MSDLQMIMASSLDKVQCLQEALVSLGAAKLAFDLLASNGHTPAAYASALRLMAALSEGSATARMAVTGTGLIARLAFFPESAGNSGPVAQGEGWVLQNYIRQLLGLVSTLGL